MSVQLRGTDGRLVDVTSGGELKTFTRIDPDAGSLPVKSANLPTVYASFAPGTTGIVGPLDVTEAGNVTFILKNTDPALPFGGSPQMTLEQSDDGVSWAALPAVRTDTNVVKADRFVTGNTPYNSYMFDAECEGVNYVRVRVTVGCATNPMTIGIVPGGTPFTPAVAITEPVRRTVLVSGANLAVGASGVDTMLTLNRVVHGREFDTSTSFLIPAGKKYRFTNFLVSQVGNSSTSSARTTFQLRFSPTGPVTTASPVMMSTRIATVAQSGDYNNIVLPIPEGFEVAGDGQVQFGMSVNSTFSAAPTVDVLWVGYEY